MRTSVLVIGIGVLLCVACDDQKTLWALDQDFDPTTALLSPAPSIGQYGRAQTFFSYMDGYLHSVAFKLEGIVTTPAAATLAVEFRETSGGVPNAVTLGVVELDSGNLPPAGSPDWVWFDFRDHQIPIFNGTQYAIVIRRSFGTGEIARIHGASGNQYAGGRAFLQTGATSFSDLGGDDYAFKEGAWDG